MMWKDMCEIGVELIDGQHEELFRRVLDFIKTIQAGGPWESKLSKVKETAVTNLSRENYKCDVVPPQIIIGQSKSILKATEKPRKPGNLVLKVII